MRLVIPPPTDVLLHVLDGATGAPTEIKAIHWGPLSGGRGYSRTLVSVNAREIDGAFEFRAPVGTISMGSFGGDYTSLSERAELQPGKNEFTYEVQRNCPLLVLFLDGETPIPIEGHFFPKPKHLGGEGKLLFSTGGQAGFKTALSEPGSYLFTGSEFPQFDGFEPIPDQTITVVRAEEMTFKIQLVRLK